MFNTTNLQKLAAGLIGAWLVLLLGSWVGEEIYHAEAHGDPSYVIEVESADAEPEEEVDIATLFASADAASGAKVFRKCQSCHKLEAGANGTGPYLLGVVGREIAAADGFGYSGSLASVEGVWDVETLNQFLENPKSVASGTAMAFNLKKIQDRLDVIAYLDSLDD